MNTQLSLKQALHIWAEEKQASFIGVARPPIAGDDLRNEKVLNIQTGCGKYEIALRKCKEENDLWAITVRFLACPQELEGIGFWVDVLDNKRKRLISGKISHEPLTGWLLDRLEAYDLSFVSVIPKGIAS